MSNVKPQYPVIIPHPDTKEVIGNFNKRDWLTVAGFTATGFPVGYFFGKPVPVRSMWAAALIGAVGGMVYSVQQSTARLTGWLPNEDDVARRRSQLKQ
eukprot:EC714974.1.p1 GENE.EC714974.1~~EC714974.1.p1  ORF type:complete len:98 (+),score=8.91 EC714974.1:3-296(+)